MRKEYDFSKARPNPYAKRLKKSVTIQGKLGAGQLFRAMLPWLEMGLQEDLNGALTNG